MTATGQHTGRAPLARRNLGIEYLRFALAFAVLLYHYVYFGPHIGAIPHALTGHDVFNYGRFGVAAFFVISGFVIAQSAEGKVWQAFLASRIGRLWPAMLLCATMTLALTVLAHPLRPIDLWRYATAAPLLPLLGTDGPYLESSYWSISVELRFYALVLLLLLVGRLALLPLALTLMGGAAFALHYAGVHYAYLAPLLFPYVGFFGLGVIFHHYLATGRALESGIYACIHLGFAIVGTHLWVQFHHMPQEEVPSLVQSAVIALVCGALVLGAYLLGRRLTVAPLAVLAGGISYPLYLLHQRFGYDLIYLYSRAATPEMARLMAIASVLVLAALIHLRLERRAGRPLKAGVYRALGWVPA